MQSDSNTAETKLRATPYLCEYEWRPTRKELDEIMLDIGLDPTADNYLDDLARSLVALRGIRVEYKVLVGFRWPAATLASLGDEKSGAIEEATALRLLRGTNDAVKKSMVQRAIDGRILPRQPVVSFGELGTEIAMSS